MVQNNTHMYRGKRPLFLFCCLSLGGITLCYCNSLNKQLFVMSYCMRQYRWRNFDPCSLSDVALSVTQYIKHFCIMHYKTLPPKLDKDTKCDLYFVLYEKLCKVSEVSINRRNWNTAYYCQCI